MAVNVRINGKPHTVEAPTSVTDILAERKLRPEVVVVQVNGRRLRAVEFGDGVADGDKVDIVLQLAGGSRVS